MRSFQATALAWVVVAVLACQPADNADQSAMPGDGATAAVSVERGQYLVETAGGCHDCHTPKVMGPAGPALDTTRLLAGHPADRPVPTFPAQALSGETWVAASNLDATLWAGPWGISFAANLTPDASGLGNWTADMFIQAMRTGRHAGAPDGRMILPPMPWQNYGQMTDEDLRSMFMYLQSIRPIANAVPAPMPPPGG